MFLDLAMGCILDAGALEASIEGAHEAGMEDIDI